MRHLILKIPNNLAKNSSKCDMKISTNEIITKVAKIGGVGGKKVNNTTKHKHH